MIKGIKDKFNNFRKIFSYLKNIEQYISLLESQVLVLKAKIDIEQKLRLEHVKRLEKRMKEKLKEDSHRTASIDERITRKVSSLEQEYNEIKDLKKIKLLLENAEYAYEVKLASFNSATERCLEKFENNKILSRLTFVEERMTRLEISHNAHDGKIEQLRKFCELIPIPQLTNAYQNPPYPQSLR